MLQARLQTASGVVARLGGIAALWILAHTASMAAEPLHITYLVSEMAAEPYQITSAAGEQSGLVTDIVQALLAKSNVSWQVESHPYRRVQRILHDDTHPNWISYGARSWGLHAIWARAGIVEEPLFRAVYQLVLRADAPTKAPLQERQKRLIVIHGYRYGGDFNAWVTRQGHTLVRAPSHQHALSMLRMGRGDMYLTEDIRVQWEIKRAGLGSDDLHIHDFSSIISPIEIHIIYDSRLPESFQAELGQQLKTLQDAGKLDAIRQRYGASASTVGGTR